MDKVYHRNKAPYGRTSTIIAEDASAYVMVTVFDTNKDTAVIHDLVVHRDRRGEGLGSEELEAAVAEAERMNAKAVRLSVEPGSWLEEWYKRHGFHATGEVEDMGRKLNVLERSL